MKPGEIKYNFSKVEKNKEFQSFLKWSLKNKLTDKVIDVERCKGGIDRFLQSLKK